MGKATLKIAFGGVSVVCALLSLGLALTGVWYTLKLKEVADLNSQDEFEKDTSWIQVVPIVFASIGSLGMLVTCCGLCGSLFSNKSCLISYNVFAVIIIISMIACGVIAIMLGINNNDDYLRKTFLNAFAETKDKANEKGFHGLESQHRCCGVFKPDDYPNHSYPNSCCEQGTECVDAINKRPGCLKVFKSITNKVFYGGTAGCGMVALMAFVSMILSIMIVRKMKNKDHTHN